MSFATYLSAAQTVLYGDLVRSLDVQWMFLVTRRELSTLTHTLCITAWSPAQTWDYLVSHVFARTDNLRSLSLPSFDLRILRHMQLSVSGHAEAELPRQGSVAYCRSSFQVPSGARRA